MTSQIHHQYLKRCPVKNISYNTLLVDVTSAVRALSKKSRSNVDISVIVVLKAVV